MMFSSLGYCRNKSWTSILKTKKEARTTTATPVANAPTLLTGEITVTTVTIKIQELTGMAETSNRTRGMRKIPMMTGPGSKTLAWKKNWKRRGCWLLWTVDWRLHLKPLEPRGRRRSCPSWGTVKSKSKTIKVTAVTAAMMTIHLI